jgi:Zn-dependent peptidase ImmA (M78 family)/DNA-binding XRE family transcriptional regulator
MASFADVTPDIITWAREMHRLTQSQLAEKVHVHENQIEKWEEGKTKPTFNQAIDLANALRIPLGYLFLTTRPALEEPLPDLRTRRDKPLRKMTPELREVVYGVLNMQDWYREYRLEYNAERLPFVETATTKSDHRLVAEQIRAALKINPAIRESATTRGKYLSALVDRSEYAGILVMQSGVVGMLNRRPLSVEEFQGFVAIDNIAPIIFINARDFVNARIFTLAHELAHIWIGKSGIVNPDESETAALSHSTSTEQFCNSVAAEILVPKDEFLRAYKLDGSIYNLAARFRVSPIVTLRRSFELGKIDATSFYSQLKSLQGIRRDARKSKGGPTYPELIGARHSATFVGAIMKDVRSGGTLLRDAAQLLHLKPSTLDRIAQTGEY